MNERQQAVHNLIVLCDSAREAFTRYHILYHDYHAAVVQRRSVKTLVRFNHQFLLAKTNVRQSFAFFQSALHDLNAQYPDDAFGRCFASIGREVDSWDQTSVRAKYAAVWMREFAQRLHKLNGLRRRQHLSAKRQRQLDRFANEPFPDTLCPASVSTQPPLPTGVSVVIQNGDRDNMLVPNYDEGISTHI
jgi:hypothetical protein